MLHHAPALRAVIVGLVVLPVSLAQAHDKCDSLANAATAGGVWKPWLAAFQVGYYAAKFVDENVVQTQVVPLPTTFDLTDAEYDGLGLDDTPRQFKFMWDAATEHVRRSLLLNQAVGRWDAARDAVVAARLAGDAVAEASAMADMNAAHTDGIAALDSYRTHHTTFADAMLTAITLLPAVSPPPPSPLTTVPDIVATMNNILTSGPPAYETAFFVDIIGFDPSDVTPAGLLGPAQRMVDDPIPGRFLNDTILATPTSLLTEISDTFRNDVANNLNNHVPQDFLNNLVPEPASLCLLAGGLLSVLRRRR